MATPAADHYGCASGGVIAGGRFVLPEWAQSAAVNQLIEIPGSNHSGTYAGEAENSLFGTSQSRTAYSGAALKGTKFILAAIGGHLDSSDNSTTAIDLWDDLPDWVILNPATPEGSRAIDVAHYSDGKPSSRHTYWSSHYNPALDRVMLYGATYVYGSAVTFQNIDGFNLNTNTWDAALTYPSNGAIELMDEYGNGWSIGPNAVVKIDKETLAKTTTYTNATAFYGRPAAWDKARQQIFTMCFGDGTGSGSGLTSYVFSSGATIRTSISFNDSAAKTQLLADAPSYAALDYDEINDCFWFYGGQDTEQSRIYKITPNVAATWDVEIAALADGSVTPSPIYSPGALNRFRYVRALRGVVFMNRAPAKMYYMRTA